MTTHPVTTGADIAARALTHWGMAGASCHLVAERENRVFRVTHDRRTYALRLHRAGYRTAAQRRSELQMMAHLAAGGMAVPAPIAGADGAELHAVDGVSVDLLTWLPGAPLGEAGQPLIHGPQVFAALGQEMARMHDLLDAFAPPDGFDRPRWDASGLVGDAPLWGRFWENPDLSYPQRALMLDLRAAGASMRGDFGLIHADLLRENVLVDEDQLAFIDFDDAVWGYRGFDLATTLVKLRGDPQARDLGAALLAGYEARRALDRDALPLLMALRAATYVGWIMTRGELEGAAARSRRFIDEACAYAQAWKDGESSP